MLGDRSENCKHAFCDRTDFQPFHLKVELVLSPVSQHFNSHLYFQFFHQMTEHIQE